MDRRAEYTPFASLDNPAWQKLSLLAVIDLFLVHPRFRLPSVFTSRPDQYVFAYQGAPLYVGSTYRGVDRPGAWGRLWHHVVGHSDIGRCIHGSWPESAAFEVYVGHTPDLFPLEIRDVRDLRFDDPYWGYLSAESALIHALRPALNRQGNPDPRPIPGGLTLAPGTTGGMGKVREMRNSLLTNGAVSSMIVDVPSNRIAPRGATNAQGLYHEEVLQWQQ